MKRDSRLYVIPPNWPMMMTMLACLTAALLFIKMDYKPFFSQNRHIPYSLIFFSVLGFLAFASNYAVYSEKLVQRILFVPVRVIPWNRVSSVSYFPAGRTRNGKNVEHDASLLLTLSPCPAFTGTEQEISRFIFRHMFRTVLINLRPQSESPAMSAVSACLSRRNMSIRY